MDQNPTAPWGLSRLAPSSPAEELPEVTAELDPTSQTARYLDATGKPAEIDPQSAGRCGAPATRSGTAPDVSSDDTVSDGDQGTY
ncbi:putative ATP-grasp-modified RiPP [Streptomyces sp. NPDC048483]|uniref:putative ATP-grasp-modified RiPP n=1 Tax=Streptomyces sp. NPDC048483 TaxID=3154927 RepID=UPI003432DCAB